MDPKVYSNQKELFEISKAKKLENLQDNIDKVDQKLRKLQFHRDRLVSQLTEAQQKEFPPYETFQKKGEQRSSSTD